MLQVINYSTYQSAQCLVGPQSKCVGLFVKSFSKGSDSQHGQMGICPLENLRGGCCYTYLLDKYVVSTYYKLCGGPLGNMSIWKLSLSLHCLPQSLSSFFKFQVINNLLLPTGGLFPHLALLLVFAAYLPSQTPTHTQDSKERRSQRSRAEPPRPGRGSGQVEGSLFRNVFQTVVIRAFTSKNKGGKENKKNRLG